MDGNYRPLHEETYAQARAEWDGYDPEAVRAKYELDRLPTREDWLGSEPREEDFMPAWTEPADHYQMYETTSEGTPISPPMPTPEALADWLADNHASAFGPITASREDWLAMIRAGSAPSCMTTPGVGLQSGVSAVAGWQREKDEDNDGTNH